MTVIASGSEREVSFVTTALFAAADMPSPPYSLSMMRPKKRSRFRKSQTSGGRSWSWWTFQSSVIAQTFATGPSRNWRSASVSSG